jgi:hypothetical protein
MKQIKTIKNRLDNNVAFDEEVNNAIAEGWQLTKREVLVPMAQSNSLQMYVTLYAELEREIITEAEKCCENCAHFDVAPGEEPCSKCMNGECWEETT